MPRVRYTMHTVESVERHHVKPIRRKVLGIFGYSSVSFHSLQHCICHILDPLTHTSTVSILNHLEILIFPVAQMYEFPR